MRKIIHVDMDAFFASVEQRDNPKYRNKPLIIGGPDEKYGVVSTCSYEAREFGVRSAMPAQTAHRLCPKGIFIHGNMQKYRKVSQEMYQIFAEFTSLIQPLGLDEAYLDVTSNKLNITSATKLAQKIKERIKEKLNLTCSVGVSYNKVYAKIASEQNKPDGIFTITPDNFKDIIYQQELKKIPMIGKKTQAILTRYGYNLVVDIIDVPIEKLAVIVGEKMALYLKKIISGDLQDQLTFKRKQKSLGHEYTMLPVYLSFEELTDKYEKLLFRSLQRMNSNSYVTKTMTLKIRFDNFDTYTRTASNKFYFNDLETALNLMQYLIAKLPKKEIKIRLIGIYFSNLHKYDSTKDTLFIEKNIFD